MERDNNMFKYATKELSQDAFICWLANFVNTDNIEFKKVGNDFIKLLADKINLTNFNEYIKNNDYSIEIKHQYKNIDVLLIIGKFYIIIEDKIKSIERDNQILDYVYKLIKLDGVEQKDIFTCYYKMYDEYNVQEKNLNAIITRADMLEFMKNIENRNLYMQDYYEYLLEIEKYSKIRDIKAKDLKKLDSYIVKNIQDSVYTSFYNQLQEKEKAIIGWGYADNRNGGTWYYASQIFNNVKSKEFDYIYAEINLKDDRNSIVIKLAKKSFTKDIKSNERIEKFVSNEFLENRKVKYYDKRVYYIKNPEINEIDEIAEYKYYKVLKNKIDIYDKAITNELLQALEEYCRSNNLELKIKKDNNSIYKYYTRIGSINVNECTLNQIEEILDILNKYLVNLKVEF